MIIWEPYFKVMFIIKTMHEQVSLACIINNLDDKSFSILTSPTHFGFHCKWQISTFLQTFSLVIQMSAYILLFLQSKEYNHC